MVNENADKSKKGIIILFIVIILIFGLLFYFLGIRGILSILKWFFIIMLILAIFGVFFYFVWYLFIKKHKFDVTYVNKQKFLDACHKGMTNSYKNLYVSGDKGHSRIKWGKITGYCRISVLRREPVLYKKDDEKHKKGEQKTFLNKQTKEIEDLYDYFKEEQDLFSISHRGWFMGLFEEEDIIRVNPTDHDELVGDITLYGFSLIPLSEYWFLNSDLLDVNKIDIAIWNEAKRGIMFEMLRDSKDIIDKASGLDTGHQKRIEEKSIMETPVTIGKN